MIKQKYDSHLIDTDKCVANIGNRFNLVLVGAVRVRELHRGHAKKVSDKNSFHITALKEIEAGHIGSDYLKRV